jgi:hypothetical protein
MEVQNVNYCYIFYVTRFGQDRGASKPIMLKPYDNFNELLNYDEIKEVAKKIFKEKSYVVHKVDIREKRGVSLKFIKSVQLTKF